MAALQVDHGRDYYEKIWVGWDQEESARRVPLKPSHP